MEKWISLCCNAPATEPGYPDSEVCSKCKEHSAFVDDNEIDSYDELDWTGYDDRTY